MIYCVKIYLKRSQLLSDTIYIDPLNTHTDAPPDEKDKFEDEGNEYVEGNEREKRKWPGKSAEIPRKYEVIGTVLDCKVMFSSSSEVQIPSSLITRISRYFEINEFSFIGCLFLHGFLFRAFL